MKIHNRLIILINIFWFAIIAFLSYRMPMISDDFLHRLSFATGEQITSAGMIPASVATYYMTWGGRALSMFFIQLMLMLPRWIYALCNGLIYVAVCNLICAFSHSNRRPAVLGLAYLFGWFFMPDFAEVTTWLTANITYLWTTALILAIGLIYYRDYKGEDKKAHSVIAMLILGFGAGLSNEAGACTLILALAAYFIWSIKTKHRIMIDRIAGIIGVIVGTAVLLLAPGNRVRAGSATAEAEHGNLVSIFAFRFARESFYTLLYLLVPFVICLALYLFRRLRRTSLSAPDVPDGSSSVRPLHMLIGGLKELAEPAFWILAFVSIYVLTFSAGFADRIFQFPTIMLSISFAMSLNGIFSSGPNPVSGADPAPDVGSNPVLRVLVIGLMLMVLVEIVAGVLYSNQTGTYFDRRMHYYYIEEESSSGLMPGNGMTE